MQQVGPSPLRAGSQLLHNSGNRLRHQREERIVRVGPELPEGADPSRRSRSFNPRSPGSNVLSLEGTDPCQGIDSLLEGPDPPSWQPLCLARQSSSALGSVIASSSLSSTLVSSFLMPASRVARAIASRARTVS